MYEFVPLKSVIMDQEHEQHLKNPERLYRSNPRDSQKSLSRERHRYEVMVANAQDIMAIMDTDAVIQFMNPAAERVIGYAPEEMIGQELFEFLHPDDIHLFEELLDICVDSPGANLPVIEMRLQHKSGAWRWMRIYSKDLQFDEIISGIYMDIRDVTEYKELKRLRSQSEKDAHTK